MRRERIYSELINRSKAALRIGIAAYALAVLAFYILGCLVGMNARFGRSLWDMSDDLWPLRQCLYQVGITFTTVGYTDELGTNSVEILRDPESGRYYAFNTSDGLVPAPGAPPRERAGLQVVADYSLWTTIATVLIAVVGMGVFIYAIGAITAFFVEGAYVELTTESRTHKQIAKLRDHVIICGAEPAWLHTSDRFRAEHVGVLAIDSSSAHIAHLRDRFPDVVCLRADPTDAEALQEAGIERARGLVAALPDDKDNLIVVVTARQQNPRLLIVSRASSGDQVSRLRRAGAHQVVLPALIGGLRLASEAIRPTVVRLLDAFMGHEEEHHGFRFAGIEVPPDSPLCGKTLAEVRFYEAARVRVVALRQPHEESFVYNPGAGVELRAGTIIGVVADDEALGRIESVLRSGVPRERAA